MLFKQQQRHLVTIVLSSNCGKFTEEWAFRVRYLGFSNKS